MPRSRGRPVLRLGLGELPLHVRLYLRGWRERIHGQVEDDRKSHSLIPADALLPGLDPGDGLLMPPEPPVRHLCRQHLLRHVPGFSQFADLRAEPLVERIAGDNWRASSGVVGDVIPRALDPDRGGLGVFCLGARLEPRVGGQAPHLVPPWLRLGVFLPAVPEVLADPDVEEQVLVAPDAIERGALRCLTHAALAWSPEAGVVSSISSTRRISAFGTMNFGPSGSTLHGN